MKRFIVISFVIILLLQGFVKLMTVAYFNYNRAYIASYVCENREVKGSKCEGRCFLNKKLNAQDNQSNRLYCIMNTIEEAVLFFSLVDLLPHKLVKIDLNLVLVSLYIDMDTDFVCHAVFHPPKVSLIS